MRIGLRRHRDLLPLTCAMLLVMVACTQEAPTNSATHAAELSDTRAARPIPENISSNLAPLLAAKTAVAFRRLAAERGYSVRPNGVLVDVQTEGLSSADRARFASDGVVIDEFSAQYERVSAVVRGPAALRALATLSLVRYIAPEYGSVSDSGDQGIDR